MAVEDFDEEGSQEEYEEVEVDYREKLLSVIEVIKRGKEEKQVTSRRTKNKRGSLEVQLRRTRGDDY